MMKKTQMRVLIIILLLMTLFIINNFLYIAFYDYEEFNTKDIYYGYYYGNHKSDIMFYNDNKNNCVYIELHKDININSYNIKYNPMLKHIKIYITDYTKSILLDWEGERPSYNSTYIKLNNINVNKVFMYIDNKKEYSTTFSIPKTLKYIANGKKAYYYDKEYIHVSNIGKYGLINKEGDLVFEFMSLSPIRYNDENLFIIQKEDKLYYLINSNMEIISDGYEHMEFLENSEFISVYEEDFISGGYRYGLIDKSGNLVAKIIYATQDDIELGEDSINFAKEGKYVFLVNSDGEKMSEYRYTHIERTESGYFVGEIHTQYYLISPTGERLSSKTNCYLIKERNSDIPLFMEEKASNDFSIFDKYGNEIFIGMIYKWQEELEIEADIENGEMAFINNIAVNLIFENIKKDDIIKIVDYNNDGITIEYNNKQEFVEYIK